MLVNPPHTYLMHCPQCIVNVYTHETNGEGRKVPYGGGSGGGLTGPSVATQSE